MNSCISVKSKTMRSSICYRKWMLVEQLLYTCLLDFTQTDPRMPPFLITPMKRSYSFGNTASLKLTLVHLALIALITMAMVTTLPTVSLQV